jgi:hypothetical protein
MQVRLVDESPGNSEQLWMSIEAPSQHITLRELIRLRVESEVERYNQGSPRRYHGLVQPDEVERILQGDRPRAHKTLDPREQVERAWSSFEKNRFFVSIDGRPVGALDEELRLDASSDIRFLKLLPLIGG